MGGPAERSGSGALSVGAGRPGGPGGHPPGPGGPRSGRPGPVVVALAQGLARYRFVLAAATTVLLFLALLPNHQPDHAAAGRSGGSGFTVIDPAPGHKPAPRKGRPTPAVESTPDTAGAPAPGSAAGGRAARTPATTAAGPGRAGGAVPAPSLLPSPPCDPATGRLAVPARSAPPCVPSVAANGGATAPGVTGETITVAVYLGRGDVASTALAAAAGSRDTADEVAATYRSYADYFEHHYQTWGRRARLVFVTPSGADDDADRARADAIRVATDIGAFASWGGPARTAAYADELAARRVLCICAVSETDAWFAARAPYVISPEPTLTQRIALQSEYVAKRLAGRPARNAGDLMLAAQNRTFGLVYDDSPGGFALAGAEALERELRRAGVELAASVGFRGTATAPAAASEEARKVVGRLRQAGVTSVLYVGDALFPVFMTQEATREGYGPEWVLLEAGGAGGGLTGADTTFSGRTYDQTQWAHAFGLSFGAARLAPGQDEAWRVHAWHTGQAPPARASHALIYRASWIFFTGMHLGGPLVTAAQIRDGLFRLPPSGGGTVTSPSVSFGRHGLWPGEDYGAGDDVTELWWDATTAGPDEAGASGVGMYRYVDGGKRFLLGQQPATDTGASDRTGTVTVYDEPPPSDRPPSYPHRD